MNTFQLNTKNQDYIKKCDIINEVSVILTWCYTASLGIERAELQPKGLFGWLVGLVGWDSLKKRLTKAVFLTSDLGYPVMETLWPELQGY